MTIDDEFGSDNHSGVHPDIIKAIESVNVGYSVAYGDDSYTQRAVEKFKEHFGKDIDVYFVGNGTAANILGLKVVTNSFNSIFCAEVAHLNVHECCGPEKFTGCKLVTIPTSDGKLTIDFIKPHIIGVGDPHMAQPKVISITQSTERGTIYTPKEIRALSDFAHSNNAKLITGGGIRTKEQVEGLVKAGADFVLFSPGLTMRDSQAEYFLKKLKESNYNHVVKQLLE